MLVGREEGPVRFESPVGVILFVFLGSCEFREEGFPEMDGETPGPFTGTTFPRASVL